MKAGATLSLLVISCFCLHAADSRDLPASPIIDPEKEGQELAKRLRSSAPAENSTFTGVLEITERDGTPKSFPISSEIILGPGNWKSTYKTQDPRTRVEEILTIVHTPGQSNQYTLKSGPVSDSSPELTRPFAQSDFWLLDLGMEFFHWPVQRAIRSEMSRSRPCRVLESANPKASPSGYSKVLSWIDLETGGILQAEAYDRRGKLLKKFAIGRLQKVDGEYQLRDMRIRNVQTRRQTELKFDLSTRKNE